MSLYLACVPFKYSRPQSSHAIFLVCNETSYVTCYFLPLSSVFHSCFLWNSYYILFCWFGEASEHLPLFLSTDSISLIEVFLFRKCFHIGCLGVCIRVRICRVHLSKFTSTHSVCMVVPFFPLANKRVKSFIITFE